MRDALDNTGDPFRDRDFTGPFSKKILSEAFSEWPTIHPEQRSGHFRD
jgi:hypothetical protein